MLRKFRLDDESFVCCAAPPMVVTLYEVSPLPEHAHLHRDFLGFFVNVHVLVAREERTRALVHPPAVFATVPR